ncbi:MAG: exodeoxyribonuclease VII small subunit [Oscillatoriales cyanobacterium C42_A2020_001]|nr:exodeoxyribonuclease VII small subunit [Leptolyngbyaceae cyanobacterium C42_A2020_001]
MRVHSPSHPLDNQGSVPASEPVKSTWSYEATVEEIEAAIAQIEAGDLDLAEVFDRFSTAVENLRQCEIFLAQRQRQMDLLIETLSDEPEF